MVGVLDAPVVPGVTHVEGRRVGCPVNGEIVRPASLWWQNRLLKLFQYLSNGVLSFYLLKYKEKILTIK